MFLSVCNVRIVKLKAAECRKCGKKLRPKARFCTGCGTPTSQDVAPKKHKEKEKEKEIGIQDEEEKR